ncbi:MAG: 50S ribosomal protein L31, partial [Candidatus Dojkabacteria bacterium]
NLQVMKKEIHTKYHKDANIRCMSCGTEYEIGSTKESYSVAICSKCHPFYTGEQVIIDTANKISTFKERQSKTEELKKRMADIEKKREERKKQKVGVIGSDDTRLSLKDLLKAKSAKK